MAAQSAPEFKRPIALLENDAASLSRRGSEPASIVYGDLRAAGAPFGWLNTMSVASIDGGTAGGATRRYTHHEADGHGVQQRAARRILRVLVR